MDAVRGPRWERGSWRRWIADLPAAPARWSVPAAAIALAGVWGVSALIRVTHAAPGPIDHRWDALMAAADGPVAHHVAAVLGVIGTGLPASALAVVVGVLIGAARGWFWTLFVVASSSISALDVAGMKALSQRARPDVAFGSLNAFPSGHTANAALLGVVVLLLVRQVLVRCAAVAWILGMAWSRTELHAHWLTDVLAAIVVGMATALLLLAAARRAIARTDVRPAPH